MHIILHIVLQLVGSLLEQSLSIMKNSVSGDNKVLVIFTSIQQSQLMTHGSENRCVYFYLHLVHNNSLSSMLATCSSTAQFTELDLYLPWLQHNSRPPLQWAPIDPYINPALPTHLPCPCVLCTCACTIYLFHRIVRGRRERGR